MKSRIKFKLAKKIQGFLLGRIISFFLVRKISHLFDKSINLCLKNLDWNSNLVLREMNKWVPRRFLTLPRYRIRRRKFQIFLAAIYMVHIGIYTKIPLIIVSYMIHHLPMLKRFWFFIYFMLELLKYNSTRTYSFTGLKLQIKGRFQRRRRVRTFSKRSLYFPWATLKYDIHTTTREAYTIYGMFSIKLWLQYIS